jgi:hypothetical protein
MAAGSATLPHGSAGGGCGTGGRGCRGSCRRRRPSEPGGGRGAIASGRIRGTDKSLRPDAGGPGGSGPEPGGPAARPPPGGPETPGPTRSGHRRPAGGWSRRPADARLPSPPPTDRGLCPPGPALRLRRGPPQWQAEVHRWSRPPGRRQAGPLRNPRHRDPGGGLRLAGPAPIPKRHPPRREASPPATAPDGPGPSSATSTAARGSPPRPEPGSADAAGPPATRWKAGCGRPSVPTSGRSPAWRTGSGAGPGPRRVGRRRTPLRSGEGPRGRGPPGPTPGPSPRPSDIGRPATRSWTWPHPGAIASGDRTPPPAGELRLKPPTSPP